MSDQTVFFIRGFMRSGTNWLNNILNLHPDINCKGEFHLQRLNRHFNMLANDFYSKSVGMYKNEGVELLKKEYQRFIKNIVKTYCGNYPIVGDRTPVGLVDFILPDCKYIIISRDGRDVVVSWFFHALRNNIPVLEKRPKMQKKRKLLLADPTYFDKFPDELLDCEESFKEIAKIWNDTLVDNKRKCDSDQFQFDYYWLEYEKLHANTEKVRNELYEFLGADPKKAKPLGKNTTAGFNKHRPMEHNRKGKVGDWKNYFTSKNEKWFAEVAREGTDILNLFESI